MSRGQVYFAVAVGFALLVAVFAIQNPEPVTIRLLFWQFSAVPEVLLILVSTASGALVALLLGLFWNIGKFMHIRRLEGEIRDAKNQMSQCPGVAEDSTVSPKE